MFGLLRQLAAAVDGFQVCRGGRADGAGRHRGALAWWLVIAQAAAASLQLHALARAAATTMLCMLSGAFACDCS